MSAWGSEGLPVCERDTNWERMEGYREKDPGGEEPTGKGGQPLYSPNHADVPWKRELRRATGAWEGIVEILSSRSRLCLMAAPAIVVCRSHKRDTQYCSTLPGSARADLHFDRWICRQGSTHCPTYGGQRTSFCLVRATIRAYLQRGVVR